MTTDTIRAALDTAGRYLCFGQNGIDCDTCLTADQCRKPGDWNTEVAATVAAFLNAPRPTAETIRLHLGEVSPQGMRDIYAYHRWLAAYVERLSKEEPSTKAKNNE